MAIRALAVELSPWRPAERRAFFFALARKSFHISAIAVSFGADTALAAGFVREPTPRHRAEPTHPGWKRAASKDAQPAFGRR